MALLSRRHCSSVRHRRWESRRVHRGITVVGWANERGGAGTRDVRTDRWSHLHKASLKRRHKDRGRKEMPIDLPQPTLFSRPVLNIHKTMICGLLPTPPPPPPPPSSRCAAQSRFSPGPIHFLFRIVFTNGSSRYLLMIELAPPRRELCVADVQYFSTIIA